MSAPNRSKKRMTRQKEAVMRAVLATTEHPSAEQVFQQVRQTIPSISLGTVYRILGTLVDEGRLRVISTASGPRRYDPAKPAHAHIVCERCGAVADVPFRDYEDLRLRVAEATGYTVHDGQMRWTGVCAPCQATVTAPREPIQEE